MIKWIKKNNIKIFHSKILSLTKNECYHPYKQINHSFISLNSPDWINIVAVTDDKKFIMVKQHRLGIDEITLETPGGLTETDESPEITAIRELQEETGYEAGNIHLLKKLAVNPAILNNNIYFFYAENCKKNHSQTLDEAEDIEVYTFTRDEICEMINNDKINHSLIVTAFYLFFLSRWSGINTAGNNILLDKLITP
jgi:ADP-ribose pyrophosphatase